MVTVASIVAAAVLATACGAGEDMPGVECGAPPAVIGEGDAFDGTVTIGERRNGAFVPIADQGDLELIQGAQGGWMVVPTLRIESSVAELSCAWVALGVDVGGGDVVIEHIEPADFDRRGSSFESDDLFVFLTLDLGEVESRPAALRVFVDVADQSAQATLQATLVNRN